MRVLLTFFAVAGLEDVAQMFENWAREMPPSRGGLVDKHAPDQYTRKKLEMGRNDLSKDRPSNAPISRTVGSRLVL